MVNSSVCVVGDYVNCDVEWSLDYCRFHVSVPLFLEIWPIYRLCNTQIVQSILYRLCIV